MNTRPSNTLRPEQRLLVAALSLLAISAPPNILVAQEGISLSASGINLEQGVAPALPFVEIAQVGQFYRFVFIGVEAQSDADGVLGSHGYGGHMWKSSKAKGKMKSKAKTKHKHTKSKKIKSATLLVDNQGVLELQSGKIKKTKGKAKAFRTAVTGWWDMGARVNYIRLTGLEYSTTRLNKMSPVLGHYLERPEVFMEQAIEMEWFGNGNSLDPDGYLTILGSAVPEPPVPMGGLTLTQSIYQEGTYPPFSWDIERG